MQVKIHPGACLRENLPAKLIDAPVDSLRFRRQNFQPDADIRRGVGLKAGKLQVMTPHIR
jgi:hypothetical protein